MGLCFSCGKSKDRFKDKGTKICGQIHSVVTPLHVSHEPSCSYYLNGNLKQNSPTTLIKNNFHYPFNNNSSAVGGGNIGGIINGNMATSFPNMNLTNPLRVLVSKNKNRHKENGFDLDLTYITSNIIAMGYPASKIEGVYRNHIDEVLKFLDSKHMNHYYIYNLCSERGYDKSKFHNRVQNFPFDDHNPPKMELIKPFCQDVHKWLMENNLNVAAVHCKAGKGRTGTMICCYLLHSGIYKTADEALNYYGQTRTQDKKGVTIPSQVRYVRYYEQLLNNKINYTLITMQIIEIILKPLPNFIGGQGAVCYSISQQLSQQNSNNSGEQIKPICEKIYKSDLYEFKKNEQILIIKPKIRLIVSGDVKIEFYNKTKIGRKEKQFQFWFNTFFINKINNLNNGYIEQNGSSVACDDTYSLTFRKDELDIVSKKDKQNKVFSADFQITLILQKMPTNESAQLNYENKSSSEDLPQDTPSGSSEADSSDEENWDSVLDGENMDPRGVGYRILSECEIASQLTSSSNEQQPELLTA